MASSLVALVPVDLPWKVVSKIQVKNSLVPKVICTSHTRKNLNQFQIGHLNDWTTRTHAFYIFFITRALSRLLLIESSRDLTT